MNYFLARRDGRTKFAQLIRGTGPAVLACLALLALLSCSGLFSASSSKNTRLDRAPVFTAASLQSMLNANASVQYTAQQYEGFARLRQQVFCRDAHPISMINTQVVKLTDTVKMHLLAKQDSVSEILIKGYVWEEDDLNTAMWALQQSVPNAHGRQGSNEALFVDIGANVGAFTFRIASAGYKVFAFEGMHDNHLLLRSTLCESDPVIMSRVTLFPYGAGATHQTCLLVAHEANLGDGIPVCDNRNLTDARTRGYIVRSQMEILPLDWVIQRDVKLMKVDVEGFEPFVMQGARQLLTQHRVWYIMLEFNPTLLTASLKNTTSRKSDFIRDLIRMGYAVSRKSFQGPWMNEEQIDELDAVETKKAFNLYLVHPLLVNQATATNRKVTY